jgi:hypothetical protein
VGVTVKRLSTSLVAVPLAAACQDGTSPAQLVGLLDKDPASLPTLWPIPAGHPT